MKNQLAQRRHYIYGIRAHGMVLGRSQPTGTSIPRTSDRTLMTELSFCIGERLP